MSDAPRTNTRQFCGRCQSVDRVGFLAPKDLWRVVAGPRWEHDILCLACFAEIGDEKSVKWDVSELEFYPVSHVTLQARRPSAVNEIRVQSLSEKIARLLAKDDDDIALDDALGLLIEIDVAIADTRRTEEEG